MKRPTRYVTPSGAVTCRLEDGEEITVPLVAGILRTPSVDELPNLLQDPDVLRKYTGEALRKAPWQVLRHFPAAWLRRCIGAADISPDRVAALEFLLKDGSV